jgi:hypothetical protein
VLQDIQVSQNWRTNYLLPYRGCLNVHEKNMENKFQTKNQLLLLLLLTVVQCKQRYNRTYIITLQCYRSGFKIIFSI